MSARNAVPGTNRAVSTRWVEAFGTLLLATATACGGGAHHATTAVADSAGVRIVTITAAGMDAAGRWALSETPVVDIGSDGDVALFRVTALAPLGEGRVAVGSAAPAAVTVFDEEGAALGVLGGPGDGPGEFSTVQSVVGFGGDSVAVWDSDRRRLSVFGGDGGFRREVALDGLVIPSLQRAGSSTESSGWTYLLPSAPGSFALFAVGFFGPGTGLHRAEAPSYRIDAEGRELARFGPFPGAATFEGGQVGFLPVPFGASSHGATVGDALVVGTAEDTQVRVFAADGSLLRVVRWPDHERTVEGPLLDRWDAWLGQLLSAMPDAQRRDMKAAFDAVPRPERFPAYADIVGTDTAEFWVGGYPGQLGLIGLPGEIPASPAREWLVLDLEGSPVARVETPAGFEPHAVRGGRVWGVFRDELLVESVRAYALVRVP